HSDWLTVLAGRLKLPRLNGFHRLLVEAKAKRTLYTDIARAPIGTDHHPQHNCSLVLRLAGFFGIVGIWSKQNSRCRNSTAHTLRPAPDPPAPAGTDSRSTPRANTAATARADATTGTCAVRRRSEHVR